MREISLMLLADSRADVIKAASIMRYARQLTSPKFRIVLVCMGSCKKPEIPATFLKDLDIYEPTYFLIDDDNIYHMKRTIQARIMGKFEKLCEEYTPDCLLTFGDVTPLVQSCMLVGRRIHIPIACVGSGMKKRSRFITKKYNGTIMDIKPDFLFISHTLEENTLLKDGIPRESIYSVGEVLVDAVSWGKERAKSAPSSVLEVLGLSDLQFGVVTLQSPKNIDKPEILTRLVDITITVSRNCPIIFPVSRRTEKRLKEFHLTNAIGRLYFSMDGKKTRGIQAIQPFNYTDFIRLIMESNFVLTDSKTIQIEAILLGVPCLMLSNPEIPLPLPQMNGFVSSISDPGVATRLVISILKGVKKEKNVKLPLLWDGKTSERIVNILSSNL